MTEKDAMVRALASRALMMYGLNWSDKDIKILSELAEFNIAQEEDIAKTKKLFLEKAREHESGDLADEWMVALKTLCEAEKAMQS